MIQFNLLPDIKQQYIKAKRQKHSTIVISLMVAAVALFIFVMLFLTVYVFQKGHLSNLDSDIKKYSESLKGTTDLNKVLTVQNQLESLPGLHDKKPVTSRLFTYMSQLTPVQVSIGNVEVDQTLKTIIFTGTADSLGTINKFTDTMKFTTYNDSSGKVDASNKPFRNVVLAGFTRTENESTFQIEAEFDPAIFDSSKNVTLVVPKIISTRSETEKPTDLFKALPEIER